MGKLQKTTYFFIDSHKGYDIMATKKNKHISNLTTADLKKKIAKKKKPANMCKGKAPMQVVSSGNQFKIAKKDYSKFYKIGMKYAREFNKMAIAKRKELVHNDDQAFGWTDGFVEGALVTLYDKLGSRK